MQFFQDFVFLHQILTFSIQIGEGSYGLTYKYHDDFYDRDFVVKKAKKNLSEKELKRFRQEFEIMKSLNSPYIVDVYSYNDDNNSYIMEYMDFTLDKYLHEKGYLHRDLSPTNELYPEKWTIN